MLRPRIGAGRNLVGPARAACLGENVAYTLVQTAKLHGLDVLAYLT